MIKNKTRIHLTWYTAIILSMLMAWSIHKNMPTVTNALILAYTTIVGAYIAGKTINNQAHINKQANEN